MGGFLASLRDLYREQMERYRNRPFLRAAMAACALVSTARGCVSLRDRVRLDQILETLDALQVFDPHEGVELFNELVEHLRRAPAEGHRLALEAIDEEVAREPEKAELLIRLCLAVSERDGRVLPAEAREIRGLCRRLHVRVDICPTSRLKA
jgi:tellurite resistance protein TerB